MIVYRFNRHNEAGRTDNNPITSKTGYMSIRLL
jgi:hypothetical protein